MATQTAPIASTIATSNATKNLQAESPCVRNCCLDEDKICLGCGRRLAEILEWHHADNSRQKQIIQQARQRISQHSNC